MEIISKHMKLVSKRMKIKSQHLKIIAKHMKPISKHMRIISDFVGHGHLDRYPGGMDEHNTLTNPPPPSRVASYEIHVKTYEIVMKFQTIASWNCPWSFDELFCVAWFSIWVLSRRRCTVQIMEKWWHISSNDYLKSGRCDGIIGVVSYMIDQKKTEDNVSALWRPMTGYPPTAQVKTCCGNHNLICWCAASFTVIWNLECDTTMSLFNLTSMRSPVEAPHLVLCLSPLQSTS